jgi:nicotinamide-nucleotide amidase
LTTGGLGPTVDDPTREAVALAVGVATEFRPELWDQIQTRFQRYGRQATDNNRRQAYIPTGAIPVENPVGTAPAFIYETPEHAIISLPGVPREMEHLLEYNVLPYLKQRFDLRGIIKARVLHTSGMGESQVDVLIEDLETRKNPTVGLLAHAAQVDVRITAKADSAEEADQMITEVETDIRNRLNGAIFGADQDILEEVIAKRLSSTGYQIALIEYDLEGNLASRLKAVLPTERAEVQSASCPINQLREEVEKRFAERETEIILGAALERGPEKQILSMVLARPGKKEESTRSYGGPPAMGTSWAVNTALDFLWRHLP